MYVGSTRLTTGVQPLLLLDGELTVQTSQGSVHTDLLDSHNFLTVGHQRTTAEVHTVV